MNLKKDKQKKLIEKAPLIIYNPVSKRSHFSKVNCVHHLPSTFVNATVVHNYLWLKWVIYQCKYVNGGQIIRSLLG